ncbi:hypothetical protein B0H14DRAFT_806271 [Mycena olivaceomarginata]|nr:hypothetical protein B0H14DRAFT_806271 [Mycena olivaceomarginata]
MATPFAAPAETRRLTQSQFFRTDGSFREHPNVGADREDWQSFCAAGVFREGGFRDANGGFRADGGAGGGAGAGIFRDRDREREGGAAAANTNANTHSCGRQDCFRGVGPEFIRRSPPAHTPSLPTPSVPPQHLHPRLPPLRPRPRPRPYARPVPPRRCLYSARAYRPVPTSLLFPLAVRRPSRPVPSHPTPAASRDSSPRRVPSRPHAATGALSPRQFPYPAGPLCSCPPAPTPTCSPRVRPLLAPRHARRTTRTPPCHCPCSARLSRRAAPRRGPLRTPVPPPRPYRCRALLRCAAARITSRLHLCPPPSAHHIHRRHLV